MRRIRYGRLMRNLARSEGRVPISAIAVSVMDLVSISRKNGGKRGVL